MEENKVVTVEENAVSLFGDGSELDAMLQENMEGVEVRLPVIKMSKDAGIFTSSSKLVMAPEFVGIVFAKPSRMNAFWAESYNKNPGQPPTCSSLNGVTPQDSPGKQFSNCKNCPKNQFGTAQNDDGSLGDGKACKNMQAIFVVPSADNFDPMNLGTPHKLRLSPTSLGVWDEYVGNLMPKKIPFQGIWTKFSMVDYKSKSGQSSKKLVLSEFADNGKLAPVFPMAGNPNIPDMPRTFKFFAYLREGYLPAWEDIMRGTPDSEISDMMGESAPDTESPAFFGHTPSSEGSAQDTPVSKPEDDEDIAF